MPINDIKITDLKGVGPKAADRLKVLGIRSVRDLVYYTAREHEDLSAITPIDKVIPGEKANIKARIQKIAARRAHRRRRMTITEAKVEDDTGTLKVTWFNQAHIAESLKVGDEVLLSGTVKRSKYGLSLMSPTHEKIVEDKETTHVGRIVPHYHLTAGITQKQMRFFVKQALERVLPVKDFLPQELIDTHNLCSLSEALEWSHFPPDTAYFERARTRLDFDDLFVMQCGVQLIREELEKQKSEPVKFHEAEIKEFVASLPFTLTGAQRKAAWAALQDMEEAHPMNRLLIGDVGSGKTMVAAIAMLNTVLSGQQAILMAPTEILAKQHYKSLSEIFTQSKQFESMQIDLLVGGGAKRDEPHTANIIVGTHALIQEGVEFMNLGLAVVDEQHRFGVRQRKALKDHSGSQETMPHLLSMTATPIPRTLALALYGDLDLSIMDEMPVGRKPIITRRAPKGKRNDAYDFLRKHIALGDQAFVICPLVEDSDKLEVKSVTTEHERLSKEVFPDLRIAMVHGKMKSEEKDTVMADMRDGKYDILVATSVIEVGVDIPNATMMLIEGAERFGLAQLHQFRGRVGRNDKQSFCFLFSDSSSDTTNERLNALVESTDGFALAEKDLELRGSGEMYGTAQSGESRYLLTAFQQPSLLDDTIAASKKAITNGWIAENEELQNKVNQFLNDIHLE